MELQTIKNKFGIIGHSPKLNHAIETAVKVAPTDMSVLINGESGVGKESFSKIIHHLSSRKHGPFIAVNCGAIPEGTIDSELFGHEKGAFTGATDARKGYFETTNGGTLFLDEVGELPLGTQARLLRVLENGEFIKVGSSKVMKTNVRVVAATNRDLLERANQGKFREDLYYRLATVPIRIPKLQERKDDIVLLFRKFSSDFAEKNHSPFISLTPKAQEILMNYAWPGNVRQLKNITEQICVLETDKEMIDDYTLSSYLPPVSSNLPVSLSQLGMDNLTSNGMSERDIFYKVLIDMKKDVSELKKVVMGILDNSVNTSDINNLNREKLNTIILEKEEPHFNSVEKDFILSKPYESSPNHIIEVQPVENTIETFNIHDHEIEMIKKSLIKFNGKRNKAAKELGISERTLYRKIKQFNLD